MGLTKWLEVLLPKMKSRKLMPEAGWHISVDETLFACRDPKGMTSQIAITDLSGVIVETNDSGPWGTDLWWLLFGADDRVAIAFPGGATGEKQVVDRLMKLPSFDHGQMIKAMASTQNAVFPLWRKSSGSKS